MNWRRGLMRAWAIVSVCWVLLLASMAYDDATTPNREESDRLGYGTYIAAGIGGPLALFAFGSGLLWIGAGFKRQGTKSI